MALICAREIGCLYATTARVSIAAADRRADRRVPTKRSTNSATAAAVWSWYPPATCIRVKPRSAFPYSRASSLQIAWTDAAGAPVTPASSSAGTGSVATISTASMAAYSSLSSTDRDPSNCRSSTPGSAVMSARPLCVSDAPLRVASLAGIDGWAGGWADEWAGGAAAGSAGASRGSTTVRPSSLTNLRLRAAPDGGSVPFTRRLPHNPRPKPAAPRPRRSIPHRCRRSAQLAPARQAPIRTARALPRKTPPRRRAR